jgi:hypothetical protein
MTWCQTLSKFGLTPSFERSMHLKKEDSPLLGNIVFDPQP